MKMRCYCCGEAIPQGAAVALVFSGTEDMQVDRTFLMLPEHVERLDYAVMELVHRAQEDK